MIHLRYRLTLTALVLALTLAGSHAAEATKPNIIFILIDDLGWAELGCYGNTFNETPNLDNPNNEQAVGPAVNPFKAQYWKRFGGGPEKTTTEAKKRNREKAD